MQSHLFKVVYNRHFERGTGENSLQVIQFYYEKHIEIDQDIKRYICEKNDLNATNIEIDKMPSNLLQERVQQRLHTLPGTST